ncbi:FkbM family methyltransferase [Patescibacteria group bacterium]|nr:FkbM family methyltransferase [Patescibacteria group bacterium]
MFFKQKILRRLIKFVIRSYPFYRGGVRFAQFYLPRSLTRDNELVVTHLRRGPYLLTSLNDYCGRTIYYWGDYDRKITWLCRRILRPGDCFLDIGACFGEVGFYAAQSVGALGQVHMFEPQPKLANYIRVSAELNGFDHIQIHEVALSDKDGEFVLFVPSENMGMGSFAADRGTKSNVIRVQARNAAKYFDQLSLPQIRMIKLDVEGHEENVLVGALDFLKTNKPAAIIFESHDYDTTFFHRGTVKVLSSLGYNFYQIRQKPLVHVQLRRTMQDDHPIETGYDFIALSPALENEDVYRSLSII